MPNYQPEAEQRALAATYFDCHPEEHSYQTDDGFELVKATDGRLYTLVPLPARNSPLGPYQSLAQTAEGQWAVLSWSVSLNPDDIQITAEAIAEDDHVITVLNQYEADKALAHDFFRTFPNAIKFPRNVRKQVACDPNIQLPDRKINPAIWMDQLRTNNTFKGQEHLKEWIKLQRWIKTNKEQEVYTSFSKNPVSNALFPHGKIRGEGGSGKVKESIAPDGKPTVIKVINLNKMVQSRRSMRDVAQAETEVEQEVRTANNIGQLKAPYFTRDNSTTGIKKSYVTLDDLGLDLYYLLDYLNQHGAPSLTLLKTMLSICHLYVDYSLGRLTHDQKTLLQRDIKPENLMRHRSGRWAASDWGFAQAAANRTRPFYQGSPIYLHSTIKDPEATNEEVDIIALSRTCYYLPTFNTEARFGTDSLSLTQLNCRLSRDYPSLPQLLSTERLNRSALGNLYDEATYIAQPKTLLELSAKIAWITLFNKSCHFLNMDNFAPEHQEAIFLLARAGITPRQANFIQSTEENTARCNAITLLGRFDLSLLKSEEENLAALTPESALAKIQQQAQTQDLKTQRQYQRWLNDHGNPNYFKRAIIALSTLDTEATQALWQQAIIDDNAPLQRLICTIYQKSKGTNAFTPENLATAVAALATINSSDNNDGNDSLQSLLLTLKSYHYDFDENILASWIISGNPKKAIISEIYFTSLKKQNLRIDNDSIQRVVSELHEANISIESPLWEKTLEHNNRDLHQIILTIACTQQVTFILRSISENEEFLEHPTTLSLYTAIMTTTAKSVLTGKTKDSVKKSYAADTLSTISQLPEDQMQSKLIETTAMFSWRRMQSKKDTKAYSDAKQGLESLVEITKLPASLFNNATQNKNLPEGIRKYQDYKQELKK